MTGSQNKGAWYYAANGKAVGPHTSEELWSLRKANALRDETPVWQEGMSDWRPFASTMPPEIPSGPEPAARQTEQTSTDEGQSPARSAASDHAGDPQNPARAQAAEPEPSPEPGTHSNASPTDTNDGTKQKSKRPTGKILAAVITVVAALIGGMFGKAGMQWLMESSSVQKATPESFDKLVSDPSRADFEFYRIIKQEFPDDYSSLIQELSAFANTGASQAEMRKKGAELTAKIRLKHAHHIRSAPQSHLKKMIAESISVHERVYKEDGPALCNRLASQGMRALAGMPKYKNDITNQATLVMLGISLGKKSDISIGDPSQDDWTAALLHMSAKGEQEELIKVILRQDANNEKYCPALISFMSSIRDLESGSGDRLRAFFMAGVTAS